MRRVILQAKRHIHPFNEPARDLRVQNKPLWLWQRDLLAPYTNEDREYINWQEAQRKEGSDRVEVLAHRDNLFFNDALIREFIQRGRAGGKPVRLAFRQDDATIAAHVRPLTNAFFEQGDLLLADIWYLPQGIHQSVAATPLVIDTEARERGYYHVPPYMSAKFGDLIYQLPRKAFILIDSWVHLFVADILFGVFAPSVVQEDRINQDWRYKLRILFSAFVEQRSVLASSELVHIGRNCNIDPSARIHGPTIIGNNVTIGAGTVIDNCIIGDNVTISQGCQLMLSVVSDGSFLPFRAALFMTTMMENSMVAQNTCLQLCVIGRDTFIGAGSTFTDFNLLPIPLKAMIGGRLEQTNFLVLGGCVGHHCRIGSGMVMYPGRTIESDVVLVASQEHRVLMKNISYEESDHFRYADQFEYPRLYHPRREADEDVRS